MHALHFSRADLKFVRFTFQSRPNYLRE